MRRSFVTLMLIGIVSRECASAGEASEADLIGTWRVEPSTFFSFEPIKSPGGTGVIYKKNGTALIMKKDGSYVTTNMVARRNPFGELQPDRRIMESIVDPPRLMPTNFNAFELILKKDGSFVAKNVPAGFFFDWPAMTEAGGTWALRYKAFLLDTNEYQTLFMHFSKPSSGWTDSSVQWVRREPSSPPEPSLPVGGRGRDWHISLTRQRGADLTNAAPKIDPKDSKTKGEPDGPANGSQPLRSE